VEHQGNEPARGNDEESQSIKPKKNKRGKWKKKNLEGRKKPERRGKSKKKTTWNSKGTVRRRGTGTRNKITALCVGGWGGLLGKGSFKKKEKKKTKKGNKSKWKRFGLGTSHKRV